VIALCRRGQQEIEYTKQTTGKYLECEEVLCLIEQNTDALQNEIVMANHLSQLYIGLHVYQLLFFQLSGLVNRDRI
jgi:hypothetical protein